MSDIENPNEPTTLEDVEIESVPVVEEDQIGDAPDESEDQTDEVL